MLLTSFSAKGYAEYGSNFLRGLNHFMPGTKAVIYSEDEIPRDKFNAGHEIRSLHDVPAFPAFLSRHKDSILYTGRAVNRPNKWKVHDQEKGYCFRYDAVKFCRKVFAMADAARRMQHGWMTWIDSDVQWLASPTPQFFSDLEEDCDVAYLGRPGAHSECGFMHFRLPAAMPLIQAHEAFYANDSFIFEREYHDSYLFDRAREMVPSVRCKSITAPGTKGHVWVFSPLGQYWDHLKGDRKAMGFSPERVGRRL